jgi:putative mRNA 3-end processing factor
MRVRGTRRRKSVDRGFVLSDHADWPALLETIEETGARRVLVAGRYADALARFLVEQGREAEALGRSLAGEAEE